MGLADLFWVAGEVVGVDRAAHGGGVEAGGVAAMLPGRAEVHAGR